MLIHGDSLALVKELIALCEASQDERIEQELQRRKGTLEGAKIGVPLLRSQIVCSQLRGSTLPGLYEQVLSHPSADDESRRSAEAKLLRYYQRLTLAVPTQGPLGDEPFKSRMRRMTIEHAFGMVMLRVPDELAWRIYLEWSDFDIASLPFDLLSDYAQLFPNTGRGCAAHALLCLVRDQQYLKERGESSRAAVSEGADLLAVALTGLEQAKDSLFCSQLVVLFYMLDRDYEAALESLRSTAKLLGEQERRLSERFTRRDTELHCHLATTQTHLFAPKYHKAAWKDVRQVLQRVKDNLEARFAEAYLYSYGKQWVEARRAFKIVQELIEQNKAETDHGDERDMSALSLWPDAHAEVESELGWCAVQLHDFETARALFKSLLERTDNDAYILGPEFRARVWWRLGRCYWAMGGQYRTDAQYAYHAFIMAVQRCATFAPAFTALGHYYEAVSPPDVVRASKCFQKAFELDSAEFDAAYKLIEQFANQREWALVDVIARRVIDAEGGSQTQPEESRGAHLTPNPWAWKAAGIIDMQSSRFDQSIAAFQTALRASPHDVDAWERLGEAYLESGRPVAALKTQVRALELAAESSVADEWHIHYNIAEAQRKLGRDDEAIEILNRILQVHAEQNSVRAVLAETYLQRARSLGHGGYVQRANDALVNALKQSHLCLQRDRHLRAAWKVAGDVAFELSKTELSDEDKHAVSDDFQALLLLLGQENDDARLPALSAVTVSATLDKFTGDSDASALHSFECLELAALLYRHLGLLLTLEPKAAAYAWCDVATALCRYAWVLVSPTTLSRFPEMDAKATKERAEASREQGVQCVRFVLTSTSHARIWMLLGNLCFFDNVELAQHAYIMAIEQNNKSPVPWTGLGCLYLSQGDYELGEQAFVRAQTIDPDWPASWIGRAIVLQDMHGDPRLSRALFEHAYMISDGASLDADFGFGLAVFKHLSQTGSLAPSHRVSSLLALNKYVAHAPRDDAGLHLLSLLAENVHAHELAVERIGEASALLESEYEATENPVIAIKYGVASMNLGRMRLASRDAEGALESFGAALSLLDEDAEANMAEMQDAPLTVPQLNAARLFASIGQSHASFMQGERAEAVSALRDTRASVKSVVLPDGMQERITAHISVMLAQMTWEDGDVAAIAADLDDAYVFGT